MVVDPTDANLFSDYTTTAGGLVDYRCIYVFNDNATQYWTDIIVYFVTNDDYVPLTLGVYAANEVQQVTFGGPPSSGDITFGFGTAQANVLGDPDITVVAGNLQRAMNRIYPLSGVVVTPATLFEGLTVTFEGADSHRAQPVLTVLQNNLGVTCTVQRITGGGPIDTYPVQQIAATAAPPNVTFYDPSEALPIILGVLRPNEYFPIWVCRSISTTAPAGEVTFVFAISGTGVTPAPIPQYNFPYASTGIGADGNAAMNIYGSADAAFGQNFADIASGGVNIAGAADSWMFANQNQWYYPEPGLEDIEMQGGPVLHGRALVYAHGYNNAYIWVAEDIDDSGNCSVVISGIADTTPPDPFIGVGLPPYPCMVPLAWEITIAGISDPSNINPYFDSCPCCPWLDGTFILVFDANQNQWVYNNLNPQITYTLSWPTPEFNVWQLIGTSYDTGSGVTCQESFSWDETDADLGFFFCTGGVGAPPNLGIYGGSGNCWAWTDITATTSAIRVSLTPLTKLYYTQSFDYQYVSVTDEYGMRSISIGGSADYYDPVDICASSLNFPDVGNNIFDYSYPSQYILNVSGINDGTCQVCSSLLNGVFLVTLNTGSCDWTFVDQNVSWRLWIQTDASGYPRWQVAGLVTGCGYVYATNWGGTEPDDPYITTCTEAGGLVASTLLQSDGSCETDVNTVLTMNQPADDPCLEPVYFVWPNAFSYTMSGGVHAGDGYAISLQYETTGGVNILGEYHTSWENNWLPDVSVPVSISSNTGLIPTYTYVIETYINADVLVGHDIGGLTEYNCFNCTQG